MIPGLPAEICHGQKKGAEVETRDSSSNRQTSKSSNAFVDVIFVHSFWLLDAKDAQCMRKKCEKGDSACANAKSRPVRQRLSESDAEGMALDKVPPQLLQLFKVGQIGCFIYS